MCKKSDLAQINKIIMKAYQDAYGSNLVKVYLYGSYARGDYTQDSDIDFVALVNEERKAVQKQLDDIWSVSCGLGLDYDVLISPTAIPYEEFMKMKDILPYYDNLYKEGVEISA
jgi:predicted nucleotidyltransferase